MKKVWILLLFLVFFLSACNAPNLPESTLSKEKKLPKIVQQKLEFEFLTWAWKDLGESEDNLSWKLSSLSKDTNEEESSVFETIPSQLVGSDYSFHTGEKYWSLYKKDQLLATGTSLDYFLTDKKHLIACTWKGLVYPECFVDDHWEWVYTTTAFPKIFNGKVYHLVTSGERSHTFFEDQTLLFDFEAFGVVSEPLLWLEITQSWSWILYRDHPIWTELFRNELLHNGKNLNKEYGRTDVFELRMINGQLFYFYQKEGKIWYHFWGRDYETDFSDIPHDKCCSYGMYNIIWEDGAFFLYAKQGESYSLFKASVVDDR